jgi:hypothetical protein
MRYSIAFVVIPALGPLTISPSVANANPRYPRMGCEAKNSTSPNRYDWAYKPYGLCLFDNPGTPSLDGIYHTRWSYWGSRRAKGRGRFSDGLGFLHPAHITLYRLDHLGACCPGADYTRIRVTWKGIYAPAGVWRPGGSHVFDVTPWE